MQGIKGNPLNTKLEQIIEDNPQAENEVQVANFNHPSHPITKKNSQSNVISRGSAGPSISAHGSIGNTSSVVRERVPMKDVSPNGTAYDSSNNGDLSFGQAVERQLGSKGSNRKKMLADHRDGGK